MNAAYLLDRLGKTIAERDAAIARAEALEAEVAQLREALEPFARAVEVSDSFARLRGSATSYDEFSTYARAALGKDKS